MSYTRKLSGGKTFTLRHAVAIEYLESLAPSEPVVQQAIARIISYIRTFERMDEVQS